MPRGKWVFADFYKWAGIIYRDIGAMALCDLVSAVRGYAEAKGVKPKGTADISEDRLGELGIEGF